MIRTLFINKTALEKGLKEKTLSLDSKKTKKLK